MFGPVSSGASGPPPPKKKIHAQNCRHSSPISHYLTQFLFMPIFCSRGGYQKMATRNFAKVPWEFTKSTFGVSTSGTSRPCIAQCGCTSDTDSNCALRTAQETSKLNTNLAKQWPVLPPLLSAASQESSWKCLSEDNFTLRFLWRTPKRCDLCVCVQGALGKRTVSRQT